MKSNFNFISGSIDSNAGAIPKITSKWNLKDYLGAVKCRTGLSRMHYIVGPGLYAIGNPDDNSDVFVSANYKLSFDILRKNLDGLNAWILVLDTKGINVWCAAGKGTFGTMELVSRIASTKLALVVNHRKLIVPQLGAPGIAAHHVKDFSGFKVIYGPVRAEDIKQFIANNYKADDMMRQVRFNFSNRLLLTPVEIIGGMKYLVLLCFAAIILSIISIDGISFSRIMNDGLLAALLIIIAYLAGTFLGPALLPWLPGRSFAFKGFEIGLITGIIVVIFAYHLKNIEKIAWIMIIPSVASFILMNFTGSSTFTSLSGVKKEMKIAVPFQIAFFSVGIILWLIA
jgi:hypothetical protein